MSCVCLVCCIQQQFHNCDFSVYRLLHKKLKLFYFIADADESTDFGNRGPSTETNWTGRCNHVESTVENILLSAAKRGVISYCNWNQTSCLIISNNTNNTDALVGRHFTPVAVNRIHRDHGETKGESIRTICIVFGRSEVAEQAHCARSNNACMANTVRSRPARLFPTSDKVP